MWQMGALEILFIIIIIYCTLILCFPSLDDDNGYDDDGDQGDDNVTLSEANVSM